jgi:HAD superfamily hydrolase (TIGR01509 family)
VINAVLFDFSQTLFRAESTGEWLEAGLRRSGLVLGGRARAALEERLVETGAMPGGPEPRRMPPELRGLWGRRDLTAADHRAAYEGLASAAGLPDPGLARVLYERHMEPEAWRAFPDTVSTLRELRRRAVPVAVVSNIGWDPRPVFARFGVEELVDVFVLSYEHDVQKPDPALFQVALDALGVAGEQAVMVGDNPHADGGATRLGCRFHHVAPVPVPVQERAGALAAVLDLLG